MTAAESLPGESLPNELHAGELPPDELLSEELPEGPAAAEPVRLPESVRLRVLALAADRLGALPPDEVPAALRRVARFAPLKRARLAAVPIALALESDPGFRATVADAVREGLPELVTALETGSPLPALPIEEVAAAAYLLRPPGWWQLVQEASAAAAAAESSAARAASAAVVARLQEQLDLLRAQSRAEVERLRAELGATRSETAELRRRLGDARERARRAEREAAAMTSGAENARTAAAATVSAAEAEARRLRSRLAEAESTLESARRTSRDARGVADIRLRMLLDTVVDAAQGLRRELALPPTTERPADAVAAELSGSGFDAMPAARGLEADDPAVFEQLLALPRVHLVIDGYNVTKSGYGGLTLETQRSRLVGGLAALAARTGAEVTVVFDGTDVQGVRLQSPRGVRVLFSLPGEIADDRIRQLVAAEPPGRPVVVVSSDREVADDVRRSGAKAIPSAALLKLLGRG